MQKDCAVSLCLQQRRKIKTPSVYSDTSQDQTMPFCKNLCNVSEKCDNVIILLWKTPKKTIKFQMITRIAVIFWSAVTGYCMDSHF